MENLFAFLVFISMALLIIGIFSPKASLFWDRKNEPTKKRSAMIYGISLAFSFVLFGLNTARHYSDPLTPNESGNTATATIQAPGPPPLTQQQIDSIEAEKAEAAYNERKDKTIKAPQLTAEYDENEVKADSKYKDETFYVEGIVDAIRKDVMGDIYVMLAGDQSFRNVQCLFGNPGAASNLNRGQRVTFQGKCDGLAMMNVMMSDCTLVDNLTKPKK